MTFRTSRLSALTLLLAFVIASLWVVAVAQPALAAGVVGDGTPASCLDNDIAAAFASGNGTITFNCGAAPHTILASTHVIAAGGKFVVDGNNKITLDGENLRQLFIVQDGGVLTLRNITLAHGGNFDGSAARNEVNGELTLRHVTLEENGADVSQGGAIYNAGLLEVELSYFHNNRAKKYGGAIVNTLGATASVRTSEFIGNQAIYPTLVVGSGGAIYSVGTLTIDGSTFYGNKAKLFGGALYTQSGKANIVNSTFVENTASAAGQGGAIYAGASAGTTLINVTLERNNADTGGAILHVANLSLTNTIVADSSTSADNGTSSLNCDGPSVISNGHNLIGDNSCFLGGNPTDLRNVNPKLSYINANGGPTDTLMLLVGSPAIDAGNNASCPATDQRGVARPVGSACDIGAVEWRLNIIDTGLGVWLPLAIK